MGLLEGDFFGGLSGGGRDAQCKNEQGAEGNAKT
jgi:hypothetical protein